LHVRPNVPDRAASHSRRVAALLLPFGAAAGSLNIQARQQTTESKILDNQIEKGEKSRTPLLRCLFRPMPFLHPHYIAVLTPYRSRARRIKTSD
jgi:hypothetical protein